MQRYYGQLLCNETHADASYPVVYLASDVDARDAETFMTMRKDRQRIAELEEANEAMCLAIGLALGQLDAGDTIAPGSAAHEALKDLMVR